MGSALHLTNETFTCPVSESGNYNHVVQIDTSANNFSFLSCLLILDQSHDPDGDDFSMMGV